MVQKETEAQPGAEQTAADEPAPEPSQKLKRFWCSSCKGYTVYTGRSVYPRCAKCGDLLDHRTGEPAEAETITEAFDELAAAWKSCKAELQAVFEPPLVRVLNFLTRLLRG